ncbi:PfkB family carbohydrate kinase [Methylobacterium sp. J-090]|uniref:PfkB family carbohydrate kinase n=1 Tax=Methylobacterium sp. J-090 TaxID=2836666 RepID=UPI001FB96272|nr:PfkB family carbohydrate kinase [Methylobacterium sp. J-090]MCJ2081728.1 PfkB family carbohydrate kinase [Methylobacterium sp. J-090]
MMTKVPESTEIFIVGSFVVACTVKVARLPRPGESLDATGFVVEPGGKGFNLAVTAHRLGARVDGVFAIGRDPFADLALAAFKRAGLSTDMVGRHDTSTGAGVGFIDARGENCLAVHLGANARLSAADIRRVADSVSGAVLVMATFESPDAPILAAFTLAREAGRPTLLNPSPHRRMDPEILARTAILVVNEVEAAALGSDLGLESDLGEEVLETEPSAGLAGPAEAYRPIAQRLMAGGPEMVVVTLGAAGAVAFRRGHAPLHQAAIPVETVDTIGAGDAFAAGLAAGLVRDRPFAECLLRAAACGAIATRTFGAFDAFPTDQELEAFLATEAGLARPSAVPEAAGARL